MIDLILLNIVKAKKNKDNNPPFWQGVTVLPSIIQLHSRYGQQYKNEGKNKKNIYKNRAGHIYKNIFSIRPNGLDGSSKATKQQ